MTRMPMASRVPRGVAGGQKRDVVQFEEPFVHLAPPSNTSRPAPLMVLFLKASISRIVDHVTAGGIDEESRGFH